MRPQPLTDIRVIRSLFRPSSDPRHYQIFADEFAFRLAAADAFHEAVDVADRLAAGAGGSRKLSPFCRM